MELEKPQSSRLIGGAKMWNRLVTHPCAVDKYLEWISWEQGVPDPHQNPSPVFQCQEDKSSQFLAAKTRGDGWKKLPEPHAVPLKEPTFGITYSDSLPLSSSMGVAG